MAFDRGSGNAPRRRSGTRSALTPCATAKSSTPTSKSTSPGSPATYRPTGSKPRRSPSVPTKRAIVSWITPFKRPNGGNGCDVRQPGRHSWISPRTTSPACAACSLMIRRQSCAAKPWSKTRHFSESACQRAGESQSPEAGCINGNRSLTPEPIKVTTMAGSAALTVIHCRQRLRDRGRATRLSN